MRISDWSSDVCASDLLLGALAAAPQVTGIGYFSVEGWSLRVGRGQRGLVRLFNPQEPEPAIRRMVATMAPAAGPEWGGVFWVEKLSQAHLTISTPVTRDGRLISLLSPVVSVQGLSHFVYDFTLQTGYRDSAVKEKSVEIRVAIGVH